MVVTRPGCLYFVYCCCYCCLLLLFVCCCLLLLLFSCAQGYSIESRPRDIFTISNRLSVARAKWRAGHKSHVTRFTYHTSSTPQLKHIYPRTNTHMTDAQALSKIFEASVYIFHVVED